MADLYSAWSKLLRLYQLIFVFLSTYAKGLCILYRYLIENTEWLRDKLGDVQDDYILFDCPGQIELYTHMTLMRQLISMLQKLDFQICAVFLIDSQFMVNGSKFLSGTMAALSVMVNLELPHVNILTKVDLLPKSVRHQMDKYLDPDPRGLLEDVERDPMNEKYRSLTEALGKVIEDYSLVQFFPLDIKSEDSISSIKLTIDNVIQFTEDAETKVRDFDEPCPEDDDNVNCTTNA